MYETFTLRQVDGSEFEVHDQTQNYRDVYERLTLGLVGKLAFVGVPEARLLAKRADGTQLLGGYDGLFLPQEINAAAQLLWDDWDMRRQQFA